VITVLTRDVGSFDYRFAFFESRCRERSNSVLKKQPDASEAKGVATGIAILVRRTKIQKSRRDFFFFF